MTTNFRLLIVSCFISVYCGYAYASPIVTSATIASGSLNLHVTGQGEKSPAAPAFFDDFESGTSGQPLSGEWKTGLCPPVYDNIIKSGIKGSSNVAKFFASRDSGSCGSANSSWIDDIASGYDNIYVNVWMWFDHGNGVPLADDTRYQVKTFRITEGTSYDTTFYEHGVNFFAWASADLLSNNYYVPCSYAGECSPASPTSGGTTLANSAIDSGSLYGKFWFNAQYFVKQSTGVDVYDGLFKQSYSYKNFSSPYYTGTIPDTESGQVFTTRPASGPNGYYRSILFQNYINANSGSTTTYYDDVYIDNTLQRVEVGDNPVYSECTHREIQIPTAWSNTEIAATVRQGSFPDGDYYVFVVDADNVPSAGYPITLGSISRRSMGTRQGTGSFR